MAQKIRVGIDVPPSVVRLGLLAALERADRIRPLLLDGEDSQETARACDVLICDGREWKAALSRWEEAGVPRSRVLLVRKVREAPEAAELLALSVAGCVTADEPPEAVVEKVRATAEGDWSRSRRDLFAAIQPVGKTASGLLPLGPRDHEILGLLARGYGNGRIARELHLAEGTVRNRVSALYAKLGVGSRSEAILWAWRNGFVPPDPEGDES